MICWLEFDSLNNERQFWALKGFEYTNVFAFTQMKSNYKQIRYFLIRKLTVVFIGPNTIASGTGKDYAIIYT